MTLPEVLRMIRDHGGRVVIEGDRMKLRADRPLPEEVTRLARQRKPELKDHILRESCERIEAGGIAIRIIPSDGSGTGWWLIASSARALVNDDAPVYEIREWLGVLRSGLSDAEIRRLDRDARQWKRTFGGSLDALKGKGI